MKRRKSKYQSINHPLLLIPTPRKREEEVLGHEDQLEAMIREYPWIKEDRESFGQPQSFYDFKTHDPAEAQAKRKKLGEKKETLLKTVNQVRNKMLYVWTVLT